MFENDYKLVSFGTGGTHLLPGRPQANGHHRAPAAEPTDDIPCGVLARKQKVTDLLFTG